MKSCTVDRSCTPAPKDATKLVVLFRFFSSFSLCLYLCASENSIRQISGFVLLLMLMSRVFSLAYACAYVLVRTSLNRKCSTMKERGRGGGVGELMLGDNRSLVLSKI